MTTHAAETTVYDLYIACAGDDRIDRLTFDAETGALAATGESFPAPGIRTSAYDAIRGLFYSGQSGTPASVQALRRHDDGSLSSVATAEVPDKCVSVALAPDGSALFSASYHGHTVHGLALDADGIPDPPAVAGDAPGEKAHSVLVSPDGAHAYVASLGDDVVVAYEVDGARLREVSRVSSPAGSGPRHQRFNAAGDRLYVLHEMTGLVTVFARDAVTGALAEVQRVDAVPDALDLVPGWARDATKPTPGLDRIWCADLHLAAGGRYLYTTERSTSTVTGFAVDAATGELEYVGTWATEQQPRGAAVVPGADGRDHLIVAGEASGTVGAHQIDPATGELGAAESVATGAGPLWVEPVSR
ncbi:lactonase family protein [Zhihengliuella halotolerans]|uniref:6-phosphogluconolactonase n=1 Tax=Zhihengliuella halotolerans TaxID=370736 RepID=A0A4Q8AAX6_9MICC|nr:beta-propeller fold lactonase family protein [Zhihengliuella halotolerans]RZU61292.1 6-phosphogluconolactonase [Zhihengliuella halotolerans]